MPWTNTMAISDDYSQIGDANFLTRHPVCQPDIGLRFHLDSIRAKVHFSSPMGP